MFLCIVTPPPKKRRPKDREPYPEINLQIPTTPKLPIANLEADSHQIILVQVLVEAFSRVSLELDGVCGHGGDPPQRGDQECGRGESHVGIDQFSYLGL